MVLPKYDGKDNRGAIIWVNKMEGIFTSNPLPCKKEMIMTASHYLEGDAYDWFLWWYKKCDGFSINWKMFIDTC
jgi:hypothetical protein